MPNNSQGTIPQETLDTAKRFQGFVEGLIKDALCHWERFPRAKVTSLGEELPNNVFTYCHTCAASGLLKEHVLYQLTNCEPQWGYFLLISTKMHPLNSFTTTTLWIAGQSKVASFWALCLCQINVPLWRSGWRTFIAPLSKNQLLKDPLSSNIFPTKLGRVRQEGCNLRPPPLCMVNEKPIQFSKDLHTSLC